MRRWPQRPTQQFFRDLFEKQEDTPLDDAVRMILQIAAGDADALSGYYIAVDDDLATLTRTSVDRTEQRKLRLVW